MIRRLFSVLCVAASLAACAHQTKVSPRPPRLVGEQAGDTIETIPGAVQEKATTVISVVRAYDNAGFLDVCAALVMAAPKSLSGEFARFIADQNSELLIGDGDNAVKLSPRFMHRYFIEVPNGILDAKALDYSTLTGDCVGTDAPWRPEYATSNRLNLRRTIVVSSPGYSMVRVRRR